eukprot:5015199-Amphidinium_carterae.4
MKAVEEAQPPVEERQDGSTRSVLVEEDKREEETPSGGDAPSDTIYTVIGWIRRSMLEQATDEKTEEREDKSLINPIIVDDRHVEETPVAEVSTSDEYYGVEAILDSGAGASVCSPTDFRNIAIHTKTAASDKGLSMCRWARAQGVRIQVGTCNPSDLTDPIYSPRRVATHHRVVLPCARRMGLELWRSSSGSHCNTQNDTEKAWVIYRE